MRMYYVTTFNTYVLHYDANDSQAVYLVVRFRNKLKEIKKILLFIIMSSHLRAGAAEEANSLFPPPHRIPVISCYTFQNFACNLTATSNLSMADHIHAIVTYCSQSLRVQRVLCAHDLSYLLK